MEHMPFTLIYKPRGSTSLMSKYKKMGTINSTHQCWISGEMNSNRNIWNDPSALDIKYSTVKTELQVYCVHLLYIYNKAPILDFCGDHLNGTQSRKV
jgi:hypothetical protein